MKSKIDLVDDVRIFINNNIILADVDKVSYSKTVHIKNIESITVTQDDEQDRYSISIFVTKKNNVRDQLVELRLKAKYLTFDGMADVFNLTNIDILDHNTKIKKYWFCRSGKQYVNFYQIEKIMKPSNFSISCPAFVK